jgi:hypothetical protein
MAMEFSQIQIHENDRSDLIAIDYSVIPGISGPVPAPGLQSKTSIHNASLSTGLPHFPLPMRPYLAVPSAIEASRKVYHLG